MGLKNDNAWHSRAQLGTGPMTMEPLHGGTLPGARRWAALGRRAILLTGLLAAMAAQAQLIEDVDVRREGADAVVQVRLVTPVQLRRSTTARANDLAQAFYDVLPTREVLSIAPAQRRLAASGGLPEITITDEAVERADLSRRLVFRLSEPTRVVVRAARGNRSIELVLLGRGEAFVAPAPAVAASASAVAVPRTNDLPPADVEANAAHLLASAREAAAGQDFARALDLLNQLQNLPPNAASREAQRLAGELRQQVGDVVQARAEYELFLRLYPAGPDADAVRARLAELPPPAGARDAAALAPVAPEPKATLVGSVSQFYYGGQSKVRSQEFQDSVLSGLPELASESTLSSIDQKQSVSSIDLNWRYRGDGQDMRFVFRDSYTADMLRSDKSRNRLSALYFDHRSTALGTNVRLGRQSATGGGVLGRFDGVAAGYGFAPKWRVNAVAGVPTDKLLDSKRHFYGGSVDAEALTERLSGSLYAIEQRIDGEIDRRALGTELRYFTPGVSAFAVLDHDLLARTLNIASLQGTWQTEAGTTVNALYDRRATPLLMLGNALFFQPTRLDPSDPSVVLPPATRLADLLGTSSVEALRLQVRNTTAYTVQALLGVTTPVTPQWQLGADIRLTNVGELQPVPEILPTGAPGTGNLWSMGFQAIGTNLYSARDTHVFGLTALNGPTYEGRLLSYNLSAQVAESWQLEPSLRYYTQSDTSGAKATRWTPGLRVTYRVFKQVSLESEFNTEFSRTVSGKTTPRIDEKTQRSYYYLGGRYDF